LEKKLNNIRHRLFSAKTPGTKRKLREEDKTIREELAEVLVQDGWKNETARKIASWDPYDQNQSSKFFDPEWMFDVRDGFDIVIGNPPYGLSIKGAYREKVEKFLSHVPDYEIYYYFIELSKKLLTEKGLVSYIVPNTYLFNVNANTYRTSALCEWGVELIIDFTNYALFNAATIRNSVFLFRKNKKTQRIKYLPTDDIKLDLVQFLNQKHKTLTVSSLQKFNQNWALSFKLSDLVINVLLGIKRNSIQLQRLFPEISQGLIAYDKYRGQSQKIIQSRAYHYSSYRIGLKKWLWGEDVVKFNVNWNGKEC
jgi:type I restriction-modification system DNA methylase subunit